MQTQKLFHGGAIASLIWLIGWLVAWEIWVAPLHPGGSLLALKAVPLLVPLRGVIKRDLYTCLLYTSPSPRDRQKSRMPSSA